MSDHPETGQPVRESSFFRALVGLIAVTGSFAAFIGLFFIEIPARNENALMFAMGIVFGWGSSVFASEYGASNIGRKVAEGAVKRMDRIPPVVPVVVPTPAPQDAQDAADQVAEAADDKRNEIAGRDQ